MIKPTDEGSFQKTSLILLRQDADVTHTVEIVADGY